jgi:hypothetical protein
MKIGRPEPSWASGADAPRDFSRLAAVQHPKRKREARRSPTNVRPRPGAPEPKKAVYALVVTHPARIAFGGLETNQPAITEAKSTDANEYRMTL